MGTCISAPAFGHRSDEVVLILRRSDEVVLILRRSDEVVLILLRSREVVLILLVPAARTVGSAVS